MNRASWLTSQGHFLNSEEEGFSKGFVDGILG